MTGDGRRDVTSRLVVDRDLCQGHLRCWQVAPELIDVDDLGYAVVVGDGSLDPAQAERAHQVVGLCPEAALTVVAIGGPT